MNKNTDAGGKLAEPKNGPSFRATEKTPLMTAEQHASIFYAYLARLSHEQLRAVVSSQEAAWFAAVNYGNSGQLQAGKESQEAVQHAVARMLPSDVANIESIIGRNARKTDEKLTDTQGNAIADALADLLQAVEFTPLGVRGIKAVEAAKNALGKVPGSGSADVSGRVPASGAHNSPDHEFKNFHRLLCGRFDYSHDDVDWKRDQLSLIEWIAKRKEAVEHQRDDLLKAITLIAAQSVGDDWTVEEAYAFVKQHARETRDAARAEVSASQAT